MTALLAYGTLGKLSFSTLKTQLPSPRSVVQSGDSDAAAAVQSQKLDVQKWLTFGCESGLAIIVI